VSAAVIRALGNPCPLWPIARGGEAPLPGGPGGPAGLPSRSLPGHGRGEWEEEEEGAPGLGVGEVWGPAGGLAGGIQWLTDRRGRVAFYHL